VLALQMHRHDFGKMIVDDQAEEADAISVATCDRALFTEGAVERGGSASFYFLTDLFGPRVNEALDRQQGTMQTLALRSGVERKKVRPREQV
jgi:hypothetical protein